MYARKHEPDATEQIAAAIDRTVGALERAVAVTGKFSTETAMAAVPGLVHHLLHGLKPR
ncbi:hypothetical protein M2164_004592 [Streptomyces sp. SAI-208]|nr:hypothetical protein [Streptomyces sp. SAI-041]MDH6608957.1 hypothetical protein [Streptomyces sp. SAI-208]